MIIGKLKTCKTSTGNKSSDTAGANSAAFGGFFAAVTAVLILIFSIAAASIFAAPAFAADDNGADAHARSMSAGTGSEPIVDEATTLDYGQSEEETADDQPENDEETFGEESDEGLTEEDEAVSEDADGTEGRDPAKKALILLIASAAVILAAVLIIKTIRKRE